MTVTIGGVRLVVAPMRERASATVAFLYGTGSRHETRATSGLAHFIEHMVFKGGQRHPSARAVSEAVEGVGGALNASTDREATVFWAKVPGSELAVAVGVLADILCRPRLRSEDVRREQQVVIEELRMYEDNPQDHVQTLFDAVMWPGHPLGWDIAGTEESVMSFTSAACRRHLRRHYRRDNLVIAAAGAVDVGAVVAQVEAALDGWDGDGATPDPPSPAAPADGPPLNLVPRRTSQANVVLGARAPSYCDPRRFALDLLNVVLGEGMSSRLFLELREERGLVYDVHSYVTRVADSGALAIALGCEPRRAPEAVRAAVGALDELATEEVDGAELERAKRYIRGRLGVQLESTSALCSHIGQQELLGPEVLGAEQIAARVDEVDAGQLRALAAEVRSAGLRAAAIGPFRSERQLMTAIGA